MLFSSNIFLLFFFPVFISSYYIVAALCRKHIVFTNLFLILLSLFFYVWGNGSYVLLLAVSLLANYAFGQIVWRVKQKKAWLTIGILYNLSFLLYFKYANFFLITLSKWLSTQTTSEIQNLLVA